jgi:hypothetical protein
MKVKLMLCFNLMLCVFSVHSQNTTNAKDIFKLWLFLDKANAVTDDSSRTHIKDYSLFLSFYDIMDLKMDTLKSEAFDQIGYKFYSINLNSSTQLKAIPAKQESDVLLFTGTLTTFIVGINDRIGKSYRLAGFNGNDFLNLLSDVKEGSNTYPISIYPVSHQIFFKRYKVEGLDFNCLYNGLRAKNKDIKRFPCLKRCSDPIVSY